MYLKTVDKFNEWFVSAFVTAGHILTCLIKSSNKGLGDKPDQHEIWMPGSESVDCKVLGKKWPLMVLFNFFLGGKKHLLFNR